jgi:hypothetical protein
MRQIGVSTGTSSDGRRAPLRVAFVWPAVVEHSDLATIAANIGSATGVTLLLQIGITCQVGMPGCTAH